MGRCCLLLDKVIRFYISLLVLFVSEHFVITFSLIFAFSPVISLCHWRRSVRISTLKCSWQTACTVLASAGSSPWMNLWNTTRKPPSLPANMERSCTWSNRCCDSYFCIHTGSDTHRHTCTLSPSLSLYLAVSHSLSLYTPNNIATLNRLNSSLSLGPFALASVLHPDPQTLLYVFKTVALCWWSGETFSSSETNWRAPWWALSQVKPPAAFLYTTQCLGSLSFVWPWTRLPRPC